MRASIQPIVLVGGQSRRFGEGRDKLRAPLNVDGTEWLVDRPIAALRTVFGPRVALVGACHAEVLSRGDLVIDDRYPGLGPAGGILSALESGMSDVFVLAGDLPDIDAESVRAILVAAHASEADGDADAGGDADAAKPWVVLAASNEIEPCIGLYRQEIRALFAERIGSGRRSLHDLAPAHRLLTVRVDARVTRNVNTASELDERSR